MNRSRRSAEATWIPAAGVAALVLYLLTLAPGFMPGESAFAVVQSLPDSLFPVFGHTLWHTLVRGLDALPAGSLWLKTGLLSAVTGALTVVGLLWIAFRIRLGDTPEEQHTPVPERIRRMVCMGVTLVTALFAPPLWFGATRPLPQMFGLACLALVGAWTLETFYRRSPAMLNAAAFLWGWIGTEYAAALFFTPFFLLAAGMTGFSAEGKFRWGRNLRLAFLFLAGAAAGYVWTSFHVLAHPHAELQGMTTWMEALRNALGVQKNLLMETAPLEGSLLVLFLFGGPFLLVVLPKGGGTLDVRFGSLLLHGACAVINGLMLFHPAYSPWGMYQGGNLGVFMVAPSAMLAVSSGYLSAYWLGVLFTYNPFLPRVYRWPRLVLRALVVPGLLVLFSVSTFLNLRNQRDPDLKTVNRRAREMAAALGAAEYYIGESGFNNVLKLEMRRLGVETEVIDTSPGLWARSGYRRIMAERVGERSPRLASLASIGAAPLIEGMATTLDGFGERVVLGDHPDLLFRAGLEALPVPYGYAGRETVGEDEAVASATRLHALWRAMEAGTAADTQGAGHRGSAALRRFRAAESRRANNLGVVLERHDRVPEALESYRLARKLMPGNLSALLNLVYHGERLPEEEREALRGELNTVMAELGEGRFQQWRLSQAYGYIRHPFAYVERGMAWVVSGKPALAVREYREALRSAPDAAPLRLRLAFAHFADDDLESSEREYRRILEADPESKPALLGMSRIYALRGMPDEARQYLNRLRATGAPEEALYREEVALHMLAGETGAAERVVERWIKAAPDRMTPLLAAMSLAGREGDADRVRELQEKAMRVSSPEPMERLMLAEVLFARGETQEARVYLRPLLESGVHRVRALELLLNAAVRRRDRQEARQRVEQLLSADASHSRANYILGTLRYAEGDLSGAEAAFRASAESKPAAGPLNDLANVLLETGRAEEALPLIRRAVELEPQSPVARDTLAEILLALDRVEEAYEAQTETLALAPDRPAFQLTLARIHRAAGRDEAAARIGKDLLTRPDQLTPAQRRELRELSGGTNATPRRGIQEPQNAQKPQKKWSCFCCGSGVATKRRQKPRGWKE